MAYQYGGLTLANVGDIITQTSVTTNFELTLKNSASATAPISPVTGQCWYDTSISAMKQWDGTQWVGIGGGATVSGTVPTSPQTGDLWYDTAAGVLKVYDGTSWDQAGAATFEDLTDVSVSSKVSLESGIMWDATAVSGGVTGQWVPNQIYDASPTGGASNDF